MGQAADDLFQKARVAGRGHGNVIVINKNGLNWLHVRSDRLAYPLVAATFWPNLLFACASVCLAHCLAFRMKNWYLPIPASANTHCAGIACSTFAGATEYLFRRHIYVVRWRHFSSSRISLRHRITSRRRFSKTLYPQPNFPPPPNYLAKTLFPQPNFSPPPNCPPKTLFEDTFPAAEFLPATELPTEDAFRRHFSRSRIDARHRIVPSEVKKNNTARATDQRYCTALEGDDRQKRVRWRLCVFVEVLCS